MKFCPYCHRLMKKVYTRWRDENTYCIIKQPVWHCCCGVFLYKLPKDVKLPHSSLGDCIELNDNYWYKHEGNKYGDVFR